MKKLLLILFLSSGFLSAQESSFREQELKIDKFTTGTLNVPTGIENPPLLIFIQGSGPTDRNGNQPMMKSNFAKKIAHELAENQIASFRFDKRIFKMDELKIKEKDLRFQHFVEDVEQILEYFTTEGNFSKIIVAGHSEGSLIGMMAAKNRADAFISLAGAGRSIDSIIVDQIGKQAPGLQDNTRQAMAELREKGSTENYHPMLASLFRPSVQPYMHSWIQLNPAEELKKLEIPVLIIQGTADVQVETSEAEILHRAKPEANLILMEQMNHIFRKIEGNDDLVNTKSYNEPNRPLHPDLIPALVNFIQSIEVE
ncbi:alpha/beta hydrolase [Salegentibacter sp. HM20]